MSPENAIHQTLFWFGVDIGPHLFCWAMFDGDLTLIELVLDKEILYLDMFGSF